MPSSGGVNDTRIVVTVKSGKLDEALLDKTAERILNVVFSYVDHCHPEAVFDRDADHKKAVDIKPEWVVLLENNSILPLKADSKAGYIGGFPAMPRYQGGGSSHINASKVTSALQSAKENGRNVSHTEGFPADRDEQDEVALVVAVAVAKEAEIAVIIVGLPDVIESESYDRAEIWVLIMLLPRVFAGMFTPNVRLLDFAVPMVRIYFACLDLFGIQIACQMPFVSIGNIRLP